ncbi:type-F conjugative transfer system protein TraW [Vibrio sp. 10N.222.55.A3]|uniref:Type-F conjugative transfer system protein TraW n=2 Tax=Vibrio TaxID=662 RepID=A0ABX3B6X1_9VIBR|nr:type-F conjugative transfer system protein TraW [Vibrio tasmaniensis]OEF49826.1 type-F conjugative transfer system protein TraW [Vibrio tasmaniensis 1F-267]
MAKTLTPLIKPLGRALKSPLFLLVAGLATTNAAGKNLGQVAPIFPIGEIDMLEWIDQRLKGFEASGQLADMQNEFTERAKQSIENPPPVAGLTTTINPRTFYVDPSITLPKDIIAPTTGAVIAKAGTRVNPFEPRTWPKVDGQNVLPQFELSKVLVFFDARDAQQRRFASEYQNAKPIKWVLTGGSPNKMATLLDARMYFAQQGHLTQSLNITHVPAIAYQEGTRWRIDEVNVSGLHPLAIEQ